MSYIAQETFVQATLLPPVGRGVSRSSLWSLLWVAFGLSQVLACGPAGSAPVLQEIPDQRGAVNQELVIELNASDADGDEVLYSFSSNVSDIQSRASVSRLPKGGGQFRWTPQASDVGEWFFDFVASDGNQSDTVTIRIQVSAAIGGLTAPRFIRPLGSGTALNLSISSCLQLAVEVVDTDSVDVTIGEGVPRIEGADLRTLSGTTATWKWCPSQEQIANDDRYNLLLTADDGDNPPRLHPYLLVLRSPLKPNCPGDAPIVAHTAEDISSLVSLVLDAQISDDKGLKEQPLLYYSETMPASPPDLAQMTQVTMQPGAGSAWHATIENPVATLGQGASATLYYLIVAEDDDDPKGSCDHRTIAPATGFFSMTVTNPGGVGGAGLCEPCTADLQCGGIGDHCVALGAGSAQVCLSDCAASCPADYACSSSDVISVDGAVSPQCVPVSQNCSDPGGSLCMDDALENNDSRVQALANAPLPPNLLHSLISCPAQTGAGDDEDWFSVVVGQEGSLDVDLSFSSALSDLDLALYNSSGGLVASSSGYGTTEQLRLCVAAGTYTIRVYAFGTQRTPYTLSYSSSPQSCVVSTCVPDDLEQDDDAGMATPVDLSTSVYTRSGRSICSADDDWYRVELGNSELLSVDLTFTQVPGGDLDIHIYDSNSVDLTPCSPSELLSCSADLGQSGNSNESTIFSAPTTGCSPFCTYYVVVRGFDGDENDYAIRLESAK